MTKDMDTSLSQPCHEANSPLRSMFRLPCLVPIATVAAITLVPAKAGVVDNIIFNKCSSAMRKEYEKAGQQLLLSHLNATCNCVVKEMKNKKSVDQAKDFCSQS